MSDERFREALGPDHPVVGAVRAWTSLDAHRTLWRDGHPDFALLLELERRPLQEWPSPFRDPDLQLAFAEQAAAQRVGVAALRKGAALIERQTGSFPAWYDEEEIAAMEEAADERCHEFGPYFYAAVLVRELRAYGFTFERTKEWGLPRPRGGGESMPLERKEGGGRTLWTVTVEALVDALDLRGFPYDWEKRARLAEYLPDVFKDRADPAPGKDLARALSNLSQRR